MLKNGSSWSMTRRLFIGFAAGFAGTFLIVRKFFKGSPSDPSNQIPKTIERTPTQAPFVSDRKIVRAAIYPGIGIARVGNSTSDDGFFIGPEVTEPSMTMRGSSHDSNGALKRQAARFRIYGYNAAGELVDEVTPESNVQIQWQVHLANKKSAWYRFLAALDIEDAKDLSCPRRNPTITGKKRNSLVINPGPRTIGGKNTKGNAFQFSGGKFKTTHVGLGELRTDSHGRLLVLSGLGKSASPSNAPVFDENNFDTFNNADDWYDDIADGPVSATLTIDNENIPVESSWVAVAPPNYSPNTIGWRTMYELLIDTYVSANMIKVPARTSFTNDVWPVLSRLSQIGWVNKGFADKFGRGTEFDFEDPKLIAKLCDRPLDAVKAAESKAAREKVRELYDSFRIPNKENVVEPRLWPMLYGDAYGSFEKSVHSNLIVPPMQALHLSRWVEGNFESDWDPDNRKMYLQISDVPLHEQPAMLDKSALHFCLADAFHPGCELTWPMRHASMYRAPFRIKERAQNQSEPDYGNELTAKTALGPNGPLNEQGPGDLTKWMAIPWQGDTIFCRSGYDPEFDPYIPSFWPARVPNQVLSEPEYQIVMNTSLSRADRLAAFKRRRSWVRNMKGSAAQQIIQMVNSYQTTGVIEARPGIPNDPDFPAIMYVETLPANDARAASPALSSPKVDSARSGGAPPGNTPPNVPESVSIADVPTDASTVATDPIQKSGWENEAQLQEFRRIRFRHLR